MTLRRRAALLLSCFTFVVPVLARDTDHPLLSRMAGFEINSKTVEPFSVVTPSFIGEPLPGVPDRFEGEVTSIYYTTSQPTSEAAIYRNYANAAKSVGGRQLNHKFDPNGRIIHITGQHVFTLGPKPDAPVAVLDITDGHAYRLVIVEPNPMKQSVKAAQLASEIKQQGYATLHINFETNKWALPGDGQAAVKEIAALLKSDPSLKLSIEGHTDNVGQPAANKKLSEQRAASVRDAVVAQGIAASRLQAKGWGQEVPVADNRKEDGRAQNRRVELVKIK